MSSVEIVTEQEKTEIVQRDGVLAATREAVLEEMTVAGPKSLGILSQFMILSSHTDFFLKSTTDESSEVTFKGKLIKVTRKALGALSDAHESMFDIDSKTQEVPGHVSVVAHALEDGRLEEMQNVNAHLSSVQDLADTCGDRAKRISDKFDVVMLLTNKALESFAYAKNSLQQEKREVEAKMKSIANCLELEEELKEMADKQAVDMAEQVNKTVKLFALAKEKAPSKLEKALTKRLSAATLASSFDNMWSAIYAKLPQMPPVFAFANDLNARFAGPLLLHCHKLLNLFSESHILLLAEAKSEQGVLKIAADIHATQIGLPHDQKLISVFETANKVVEKLKQMAITLTDNENESLQVFLELQNLCTEVKALTPQPGLIAQQYDSVTSYLQPAASAALPLASTALTSTVQAASTTFGFLAPVVSSSAKASWSVFGSYSPSTVAAIGSATEAANRYVNTTTQAAASAYSATLQGTAEMVRIANAALVETEKLRKSVEIRTKALSEELKKIDVSCLTITNIVGVLMKGIESVVGVGLQWKSLVQFFKYIKIVVNVTLNSAITQFNKYATASQDMITIKGMTLSNTLQKIISTYVTKIAEASHEVSILASAYVKVSNDHMVNRLKEMGPRITECKQRLVATKDAMSPVIPYAKQALSVTSSVLSTAWSCFSKAEQLVGKLEITLVSAQGIKPSDKQGMPDPRAILLTGEKKQKSPVVRGSVDPVWHFKFPNKIQFNPQELETAYFKIVIRSRHLISKEHLGEATVVLTAVDLKHNKTVLLTVPLECGHTHQGVTGITGSITVQVFVE